MLKFMCRVENKKTKKGTGNPREDNQQKDLKNSDI